MNSQQDESMARAIANVQQKIDRERALITAANTMRQSTNNPAVLSRLDTQIREGQRNVDYLEGRKREMQMRNISSDMGDMNLGPNNNGRPAVPAHGGLGARGAYGAQDGASGGRGYTRPRDYGNSDQAGYSR